MTTLTIKYPTFEANQVLTSEHLNQLFHYLDDQSRMTRTNLIGIGIVCGLEIKLSGTKITIGKGCGVTSEGYVINQPDDVDLVGYKNYTLPTELEYSTFKGAASPFTQFELLELLSLGEPGLIPLTTTILANKAVVLFLELRKDNLRNCSVNNCDDKGAEVTVTVRPLLISQTDLDKVIAKLQIAKPALKSTTDFESNLLARLNLPDIALPRIDVLSTDLKTSNRLIQATRAALGSSLIANLAGALDSACNAFKPLLGDISIAAAKAKLLTLNTEINNSSKITHLQNYYDFIDDLIKAYDEFRWTGLDLMCMCSPVEGLFPRHLMLGLLPPNSAANPLLYRNRFLASPAVNSCEEKSAVLAQLFKRIVRMIESFNSQPVLHTFTETVTDKEIRITPTKLGDVPLSQKAIPYYYQNAAGSTPLYQLWNAEKTHRMRAHHNQSYRSFEHAPVAPNSAASPLKYELEPYNFLRIEGHLHKTKQAVMETLNAYKTQYRLPIEIIALETGEVKSKSPNQVYFDTLKGFLAQHPGVQHKAGVPMGGTFVVVCHGNSDNESISGGGSLTKDTVITDFYLPYPVLPKVEVDYQKLVRECEYEWIDSIKHLNNLMMRKYRLAATNQAPAAAELEKEILNDHYVIRVYNYMIQGVDLLNGSTLDIKVPLSKLRSGRLNAVAAELNKQLSKGLVFDYKPNSNKLLIRHYLGQDFRLELGGIQGNQIRYAYTNDGIYRWQHHAWQSMETRDNYQVLCKLIDGKYKAEDYELLQERFAEAVKTVKDMPPNPSAKELIEWERKTLLRAREYSNVESLPIYKNVLEKIFAEIQLIDGNAKIVLVGSWANGSWIGRDELVNEDSVSVLVRMSADETTQREELERFIELRQKVTGKTGASDIDLLIEGNYEITSDMLHVASGYKINLTKGKADEQKGLVVDTWHDA